MGSLQQKPEIIFYDYQFAPNAQKARNLLHHLNIPYRSVVQPFFIPRDDLLDLGITYRRVPVCCIGKDVFCDNRPFLDAILEIYSEEAKERKLLPRPRDEVAWEMFGYRTFWNGLALVPKELNSKQLQEDRIALFKVFSAKDYAELRPSALAEFRTFLDVVENEFLGDGRRFLSGEDLGLADLHAMWMIKWALQTIGVEKESGFGRADWPRVYGWIDGVKDHDEKGDCESLSHEEAKGTLLRSEYAVKKVGVDETDPTGLKEGQRVSVGSSDDHMPGHTLQYGKLIGLSRKEAVVEVDNGLRLHFPRIGSTVKPA